MNMTQRTYESQLADAYYLIWRDWAITAPHEPFMASMDVAFALEAAKRASLPAGVEYQILATPPIGASPAFEYHEPGQLRLAFELADLCAEYEHAYGFAFGSAIDFMRSEGLESVNEMIEHMYYCFSTEG